jgi:hypothetical protein
MMLRLRGTAIDRSGNEQEVDVFLDSPGMMSQPDGRVRVYLADGVSFYDVLGIPGQFNPWGPSALPSNLAPNPTEGSNG